MTIRRSWLIGAGVVLAASLVAGGYHVLAPRRTPGEQPPLIHLVAGDLAPLREPFNAAADVPRVVAMLSPT